MPSKVHKIIILGADGTGKTSIIEQAIYGNHVAGTVSKYVETIFINILLRFIFN